MEGKKIIQTLTERITVLNYIIKGKLSLPYNIKTGLYVLMTDLPNNVTYLIFIIM